MPGNQPTSSNTNQKHTNQKQVWKSLLTWVFSLFALSLLGWFFVWSIESQVNLCWYLAGLTILCAVLCALLTASLSLTALSQRFAYRLAFSIVLLIAIIQFFLTIIFPSNEIQGLTITNLIPRDTTLAFSLLRLALCIFGAFLGSLAATWYLDGLWEDNAPPPQEVKAAVLQNHIPLIGENFPESISKRAFDFVLAASGMIISTPVWLVSAFLIWFEDPGPILFVKNSVGRGGMNFHQFKLRSMVREAEQETGPVLASEGDERVLWIGRLLRKTALDELPQLLNILVGDMSFVGPRPQRTVLVHGYLQDMPEYAERHRVRPGLAGLAQVAGDYYLTPRQKLRFDRLYIQHATLGFDLRLLLAAFLVTFWYRWQKRWNGRLPRRILHPVK